MCVRRIFVMLPARLVLVMVCSTHCKIEKQYMSCYVHRSVTFFRLIFFAKCCKRVRLVDPEPPASSWVEGFEFGAWNPKVRVARVQSLV